jgi:hypothetical protein
MSFIVLLHRELLHNVSRCVCQQGELPAESRRPETPGAAV